MTSHLESRGDNCHFYYCSMRGTKYSVVDLGKMMEPGEKALGYEPGHWKSMGMFLGWEAMELKPDGELDTSECYRGETWEELKDIIEAV